MNSKFGMFFCAALIFNMSLATAAEPHAAPHWSYSSQQDWGTLSESFATCKTGKKQSPIDIKGAEKTALAPLALSYQPTSVTVINNGHSIMAEVPAGNSLTIDGTSYQLIQFHFHAPSEHHIDGKSYPMELHLVHKDKDGNLAVLGVMLAAGTANPLMGQLLDAAPTHADEKNDQKLKIDIATLLPKDRHYYTYEGSLTTPPCSENVRWLVLASPSDVSTEQVQKFIHIIHENAREIQLLNSRAIKAAE